LLLLSLLIPPAAPVAAQSTEVPSDLRIELVRTDCFTWCAAYTLTIHGDGRVAYRGTDNVKVAGEATGRIDSEAIARVLQRFEAVRFFDLRDTYAPDEGCRKGRTDMPLMMISLSMRGRHKQVTVDLHCVLPELEELGETIDRESGSRRWVR
jgi:hypothetical protein